MSQNKDRIAYWRKNRLLIGILLAVWAIVSYGFSIFLAEPLYGVRMIAIPMSFWWAQQGSILVFVVLIFVYAKVMDRLDREHGVGDDEEERS